MQYSMRASASWTMLSMAFVRVACPFDLRRQLVWCAATSSSTVLLAFAYRYQASREHRQYPLTSRDEYKEVYGG